MKSVKDLNLKGKRVLIRIDVQVPMQDGKIGDDTKIRSVIPTIKHVLNKYPKYILLLAHQGRGPEKTQNTILTEHAKRISELLNEKVIKLDTCRPKSLPENTQIILFENLRFDDEKSEDKSKRDSFAQELSKWADVYINEAFAVSHRNHASLTSLPQLVKQRAIGIQFSKEIEAMSPLLASPQKPLTLILGGGWKMETKLPLIKNFLSSADNFLLGGGIANTFLAAQGYDIGQSLYDEEKVKDAQLIMMQLEAENEKLLVPSDVVCATEPTDQAVTIDIPIEDVEGDMNIFDIGINTIAQFKEVIFRSATIIWNGPLGFFEKKPFQNGSFEIAKALSKADADVYIGGGDSTAVINMAGIDHSKFTHVSTGGGAMLEYLAGKELPGLKALE
jgi:phosphoglycerate kinase